ncbi:hypothetical protein I4U23_022584 [Adineta vaga]|nr:hypothetical protein I4U23_022584 [Adineta vaga]
MELTLDVILLIENGADVHTMDNYRATPLHLATDLCRFDIVKYFIEVHADVHRVNIKNEICLNIAGFHGHLQLIEYLLEQPAANINHQNSNADTPLHLAIYNNHIDAVKLLLSYNKVRIDIPNDQSMTPLEIAAVDLKEQIVNYILNIENLIQIQEKIQILELLGASFLCRCEEIFEYDKAYEYLMRAMRLRISNGVIKIPNQLGSAYKNHVECISIDELESIRYKYDDLRLETLVIYDRLLLSKHGLELLHCIRIQASECFENSELDRCIDLCFRGLELSIINNDINLYFMLLQNSFCPEIIQLLIDCDFDVNAVDSRGDTALHILFQGTSNSNFSIAETIFNLFLNTNRLHPDYINKNGQTALNEAKNPQLIRLYKRKVLLSLKCQCATHLNQMKINYENYLSQNLINFVEKHK